MSSSAAPASSGYSERLLPREGEEDLFGGVGGAAGLAPLAPGQMMNAEYEEMKDFIDYTDDPEQLEQMKIDARNAARQGMTPDQIQESINDEERFDLMAVFGDENFAELLNPNLSFVKESDTQVRLDKMQPEERKEMGPEMPEVVARELKK